MHTSAIAPQNTTGVLIYGGYIAVQGSNGSVFVVKGRQADIALYSAYRWDLIEGTFRAADLGGFQSRTGGETVCIFPGVTAEIFVELGLHVVDTVHSHLNGVDSLMRQARMEKFARNFNFPRNHTSGPLARLGISRIDPEDWSSLEEVHIPFMGELVHANAAEGAILLVGDKNAGNGGL